MHPTLDDLRDESTWLELRDSALPAQLATDLATTDQSRAEFVAGCRLLRLGEPGREVRAHQLVVADMLEAGAEENALLVPRRSAKTTSAIAVALGRCELRPGYQAALTLATTGQKTSERMRMDVHAPIDRISPGGAGLGLRVKRSVGAERVDWDSGATFAARTPSGEAFRSSAYDFVIVDESGEATPEQGEDLSGAILPTFDTRPDAQVLYAGTAAQYQTGNLLWDALANPLAGRIAYWVDQDLAEDELAAWEPEEEHPFARVRELVEATHPGVASGLTTLAKVHARFARLGPERFAREYLGVFGRVGQGREVLNQAKWLEQGQADAPVVPERFALAIAAAYNQRAASIVAAWRDAEGRAHGYVLDHRPGTSWLADAATNLARRHDLPILYDTASSPIRVEVEAMQRMTPRPRVEPQVFANVTAGAALLVQAVNTGNARHYRQPAMDEAARIAVRRTAGANSWALGRGKDADADISPLEAWALALRWFDDNPHSEGFGPIMAA